MKILKKLLIIGLFSFLFISNIKAITSEHSVEIKYNETFYNDINQDRINAIHDYIDNHNLINSNEQGNILIKYSNMNQNTWSVDLINSTSWATSQYKTGSNDNPIWFYYNKKMKYDVTFNNNSITSFSGVSSGAGTLLLEFGNLNPLNENVIVEISNTYFDTYYFNNNTWDWEFQSTNYTDYTNIPIKVNNTIYEPNDNINVNEFLQSLLSLSPEPPEPNPYACELDPSSLGGFREASITNVSSFSVHLTGVISSSDESFDGSFALKRNDLTKINDPDLTVTLDAQQLGDTANEYLFAATSHWYNDENVLIVNYSFGDFSSDDTEFDIVITLTPNDNSSTTLFNGSMSIFYCNPLNITYDDTSYGYTDNTTGISVSTDTSLLNFLNDNNIPNLGIFKDFSTLLPPGPVDSILTIPLQMLNSINNFLGSNCSSLTVNLPFVNRNIELQCIRSFYSSINAVTFVEGVGSIASVVILVQYFINLYNWIEDHLRLSHKKLKSWGSGEL